MGSDRVGRNEDRVGETDRKKRRRKRDRDRKIQRERERREEMK